MPRSLRASPLLAICLLIASTATASAAPGPAPAPGDIRLAVIMFSLPSSPAFLVTADETRATYFGSVRSVAALYASASRGSFRISGDVFGPYRITGDESSCVVGDWSNAAIAAAEASGADFSGYTNFAFLFPRSNACPWAGLADIGGTQSFINAPAKGDVGLYHAAHELGHNLGAGHAHALRCVDDGQAVALADLAGCSQDGYADPFSLMGSGIVREPSAWERMKMGLLGAGEVASGDLSTAQAYSLSELNSTGQGTRLLLLRRAGGGYLAIEYRRAGGAFDALAGTTASAALLVHLVRDESEVDSDLLDATPSTASLRDGMVIPGSRLNDAADGMSITLVAAGSSTATISVGPTGSTSAVVPPAPPMPPSGLAASVGANGVVSLRWSAAADAAGGRTYRVLRAGSPVATVATTSYVDPSPISVQTRFGVQAVDSWGAASNVVEIVAQPVDTTAPSPVGSAWVRVVGPHRVALSWSAASDNRAVTRYVIRLESGRTVTTSGLQVRIRRLSSGPHVATIFALDAVGNSSPGKSISFTL